MLPEVVYVNVYRDLGHLAVTFALKARKIRSNWREKNHCPLNGQSNGVSRFY